MSLLWLNLHKDDKLIEEHASYYTVLERNNLLALTNGIWLALLAPMFIIAYKIKLKIQKYEQNQFEIEIWKKQFRTPNFTIFIYVHTSINIFNQNIVHYICDVPWEI